MVIWALPDCCGETGFVWLAGLFGGYWEVGGQGGLAVFRVLGAGAAEGVDPFVLGDAEFLGVGDGC